MYFGVSLHIFNNKTSIVIVFSIWWRHIYSNMVECDETEECYHLKCMGLTQGPGEEQLYVVLQQVGS